MNLAEAQIWLEKGDKDFLGAEHELRYGDDAIVEHIGFFCQQAAEKYLKAFLVAHGRDFPKTHNLEYLANLCGITDSRFTSLEFGRLTAFAVDSRYPALRPRAQVPLEEVRSYMSTVQSLGELVKRSLGI